MQYKCEHFCTLFCSQICCTQIAQFCSHKPQSSNRSSRERSSPQMTGWSVLEHWNMPTIYNNYIHVTNTFSIVTHFT